MNRPTEHAMTRRGEHRPEPSGDDASMTPLSPMQATAAQSGLPNNIGMAMQMHAWAQVQSAYFVAQSRPRMVAACRQRLLDECKDWRFACEAVWAKPVGRDVKKGLGIRFAEAAAQCWTNLKVESTNICETEDLRIMRTTVTDLESNVSHTRDTPVPKFVIRKAPPKLPDGQKAEVHAYNNRGEAQYRVRATDDDMLMMQGKELSKAERLLILKHIPKHIQDDCKRALHETLQHKASRGDRKVVLALIDQFAEIKVSARQLESYLGHDPEVLTGEEIAMLNGFFYDLADQRTTFADALADRQGTRPELAPPRARATAQAESEARPPAPEPQSPPPRRRQAEERPIARHPRPAPREDAVDFAPLARGPDSDDLSEMDLDSLESLREQDSPPAPAPSHNTRWAEQPSHSRTQGVLRALRSRPGGGR